MINLKKIVKDLWSMVVGMKVTGKEFLKPKLTVHYPRKEVTNLDTYRGHCKLVAREDDPFTPKCIMCGICIENCPSGCLSMIVRVVGEDRSRTVSKVGELMLGRQVILPGSLKKDPPIGYVGRVLDSFRLDFSYCSLCGLCVQNCPVSSLGWSHDVYLVGRNRQAFKFDLLEQLRATTVASLNQIKAA